MDNKNKNSFLITWVSCIVILLTLCFFGINDSLKGTRAAVLCPEGYPISAGDGQCYKIVDAVKNYKAGGSCTCDNSNYDTKWCSCVTSAGQYYAGTCNGEDCSCSTSLTSNGQTLTGSVSADYCKGMTQPTAGSCYVSSGNAHCACVSGSVASNGCTSIPIYNCPAGTVPDGTDETKCREYADAVNVCYSEAEAEEMVADCSDGGYTTSPYSQEGKKCYQSICYGDILTAQFEGGGKDTCQTERDIPCQVTAPSSAPTKEGYKFVGWGTNLGEIKPGDSVTISSNTYFYATWEDETSNSCFVCGSSQGGGVVWGNSTTNTIENGCNEVFDSEGNKLTQSACENLKSDTTEKHTVVWMSGMSICSTTSCDETSGETDGCEVDVPNSSNSDCTVSGKKIVGWSLSPNCENDDNVNPDLSADSTTVTENNDRIYWACYENVTGSSPSGDPGTSNPETPNTPGTTETSYCFDCDGTYYWGLESQYSNCTKTNMIQANCKNTTPTTPEDSDTKGCYKNKDTGVYKWFEIDPDSSSGTDLYEKVDDSLCEVKENPQTGQIAMFIMWVIGFAAIGYSVYYMMRLSKSE